MKSLIAIATLVMALNTAHAATDANACFAEQVRLASQNVTSHDFKGNVKALNEGIKSCRQMASAEKKKAAAIKRRAKLEAQILKAQEKLAKLK